MPAPAALQRLVPWLVAALGCAIAWHPTIGSGFAAMQSDPGDTRFNHYLLEHGWRWLTGHPGHAALWDPPFFHPARNVLAYSDTLLGAAPPYWALRGVGVGPGLSFQLWQILLGLVNFAVVHVWLRRRFGLGTFGAALGAFLFAYANPRNGQISHIQLHAHFWTIGCIESAWRLLEGRGGRWALAAAGCAVLQMWSGFYLGWFLAGSFLFAGVAALFLAISRPRWKEAAAAALAHAGRAWPWCAAALVLSGVALLPLASHYRDAAAVVGLRPYSAVYAPEVRSWIAAGPENVEGAWVHGLPFMASAPKDLETQLGVGLVTTVLVLWGLVAGLRERRVPALFLATGVVWALLATEFPWRVHLWRTVFDVVPGAGAVRALGRVGFAVAPLGAIGLAVLADRAARRPWIAPALLCVVAFEQFRHAPSFDRESVERVPREIAGEVRRRGVPYFFHARPAGDLPFWHVHLDAMWAGLLADGVPTINGYSGNTPPDWFGGDPPRREAIQRWADAHGLDLSGAAVIE